MNIQRRSFLGGILALSAAPAIVRAESLMKIWVPPAPEIEVVKIGPYDLQRGQYGAQTFRTKSTGTILEVGKNHGIMQGDLLTIQGQLMLVTSSSWQSGRISICPV